MGSILRNVARTLNGATTHYGFSGGGASPSVVLDTTNTVVQRTIGLPGGVIATK